MFDTNTWTSYEHQGGQGFLGQHIVRLLQKDDKVAEIRIVDLEPFSNRLGFYSIYVMLQEILD